MSDQEQNVHGELEPEREPAARRYVVALGTATTPAKPSAIVSKAAAAAAEHAAKLTALWNQGPTGGGIFRRLAVEIGRLLPWRQRRMHGAMIAAINRNVDATRALIDATQTFHDHVGWDAQQLAAR